MKQNYWLADGKCYQHLKQGWNNFNFKFLFVNFFLLITLIS
jgi:hypothetical protein